MAISSIRCTVLPVLGLSLALALGCASQQPTEPADTVYTNGKIYTVNEAEPWAEAVAIKDGKFLAVGSAADVEAVTGDGTVRATIDGFLAAIEQRGSNELRHHIDHCNYIQAEDLARARENGIPCSAWPMLGAPIPFITNQADIIKPEAYEREACRIGPCWTAA